MWKKILHLIIVTTILLMAMPLQRVFRAPALELNSTAPYPPNLILPPQRLFPCDPNLQNQTLWQDGFQINPTPGADKSWYSFITGSGVNNGSIPEIIDTGKDELLMWKVKDRNNADSHACVTNYKAFKSDETYIMIQTNSEVNPKNWDFYYWVGKHSSKADVETAASNVIELASRFHSTINVRREAEGEESESFKALFKDQDTDSVPLDIGNSLSVDRAFLIEGKSDLDFREVEPSLDHVDESDEKCLVFVSKKIYGFCGSSTSTSQRRAARKLTKFMQTRKGLDDDDLETFFEQEPVSSGKIVPAVHQSYRSDTLPVLNQPLYPDEKHEPLFESENKQAFKQLLVERELERSSESKLVVTPYKFTPTEKRVILGQTSIVHDKEFFSDVETTKIYEYRGRVREESVSSVNVPAEVLDNKACYLIDSRSSAGLFIMMGEEATIELRKESARKAEQYLEEHEYNYATPVRIHFFDRVDVSLEISNIQVMMDNVLFESQNIKKEAHVKQQNEIWDYLYSDGKLSIVPKNFIITDRVHRMVGEVRSNENDDPFMVWKNADPRKNGEFIADYSALKSDQIYIVVDIPPESDATNSHNWNVYYWRGKNAPGDLAAEVANRAFQLDAHIHSTIKIHREAEGHESSAFKTLFRAHERSERDDTPLNDANDVNAHRVFLFDQNDHIVEYKVNESSPTMDFTDEELVRKCLVFNLDEIHTFCGLKVSLPQIREALQLYHLLTEKRNQEENRKHLIFFDIDAVQAAKDHLRQYIPEPVQTHESQQVAHTPLRFTPKEIRKIFDQTETLDDGTERFRILVGRFFETERGELEVDVGAFDSHDIPLKRLSKNNCYIIDSLSNAGMYVWMGRGSSLELRAYAVHVSEKFLDARGYSYATPITFVHQDDVPSHVETVEEIVHVLNPVDE